MGKTTIEWVGPEGYTFSPWEGCTKISEGCKFCYAESLNHRFGKDNWGKGKTRRRTSPAYWKQPLKWNREAETIAREEAANNMELGPSRNPIHRPRVFPSLCDPFDDEVPIEWLADFLDLIRGTPNLDWLILTKRPQNIIERIDWITNKEIHKNPSDENSLREWLVTWTCSDAPKNLWLGVSVENQATADERIPLLLQIPAKVRFVSYEPALSVVDFKKLLRCPRDHNGDGDCDFHKQGCPQIHQVIVGGESGPHARPCNLDWIRSTVRQCREAGCCCFVKQLGSNAVVRNDAEDDRLWPGATIPFRDDYEPTHQGEIAPLRLRHPKGGDMEEWPEDLRVREFPKG